MQLNKIQTLTYFLIGFFSVISSTYGLNNKPYFLLKLGNMPFYAQLSITEEEHSQGLMHYKALPENHGMLFIFECPGKYAFWMAHTSLPLDLGFIDAQGVLRQISPLYPFDHNRVVPDRAILFALEMPRGWFAANKITPGAQLDLELLQNIVRNH